MPPLSVPASWLSILPSQQRTRGNVQPIYFVRARRALYNAVEMVAVATKHSEQMYLTPIERVQLCHRQHSQACFPIRYGPRGHWMLCREHAGVKERETRG